MKTKALFKQALAGKYMTQGELAYCVNRSDAWMSQVINGKRVASPELQKHIARVLRVARHKLFPGG
jgi:transcriptional regulator with XRE-family HTH domain